MRRRVLGVLGAVGWLVLIVVIALGASGLVAAMDNPPGSSGRPDQAPPGDPEVTRQLDAAQADIEALADEVESLGTSARGAYAALNGADPTTAQAAIAEGNRLVDDIDARTARIRAALAAVPYVGTKTQDLLISPALADRHAGLVAALDGTNGLNAAWTRLTRGSIAATRMSGLLADHDRLAGSAADLGRQGKYTDALASLDDAAQRIADARALRDELANTVDVTVLDEWLSRNDDYDKALRTLYTTVSNAKGKVTNAVRDADQGREGREGPASIRQPRPRRHHVRDRPGRDERRRHRHRGGPRNARRRSRFARLADAGACSERRRQHTRGRDRRAWIVPKRRALTPSRDRDAGYTDGSSPSTQPARSAAPGHVIPEVPSRAASCRHRSAVGCPGGRPRRSRRGQNPPSTDRSVSWIGGPAAS